MAKSRELKVVITGDAKQLDRTFAKAGRDVDGLGKKAEGMGKKFSTGMKVAGAAAAGALVVGLKQATAAAIEAEKSQARMETQLKASGISYKAHAKDIENVIQKHSKLAGVDDEDLQDAFTAIVRTTGSVSAAMKDMGLVTDLARAKNMDVAKAGDVVAKVHAGQYKGLKQLNLEFVKTTANVDKLKESDEDITPAELAAAKAADVRANSTRALGMIQEKVKGQAEAYGKTTAGAMERAGVAFESIQETIGAGLAPVLEKVANKLAALADWAAANPGKFKGVAIAIGAVVTAIGGFIIISKVVAGLKALRIAMIGLGWAMSANPVGVIVVGLVALGAALVIAYKKSETFRRIVDGAFKAIKTAARVAIQAVIAIMDKLMGAWSTVLRGLSKVPGFGWAKKAANAIDGAREKMRGFSKALNDVPNEKTLKLDVTLSANARKALAALNKLGNTVGGPLGTGRLTRAAGGPVPGQGNTDTVPAMLTPGEYVIRKSVVEKFGPTFFAAVNAGQKPQLRTSGGIIAKANAIDAKAYPYVWGGGHGRTGVPSGGTGRDPGIGYDCSGAVSAILGVSPPRVSGAFTSWGLPGPGSPNDTKVYANAGHIFAVLNGRGWGTSGENPGGGAGWLSYNHRSGFTIRHLEDGSAKGSTATSGAGNPGETSESGASAAPTGPTKSERAARSGSRAVNRIAAKFGKGITAAVRGAAALTGVVEQADSSYGRSERLFGQVIGGQAGKFGDEDLGTAEGRAQRTTEVQALKKLKVAQRARLNKRKGLLKTAISKKKKQLDKLREARDKAKGPKRAKMSERIKPFESSLIDLMAEVAALGDQISDITLDIGDLDKDQAEVDATKDTAVEAGPSMSDNLNQALSDVDLQERAGLITAEQAKAVKAAYLQAAIDSGGLSEREKWEAMGQLREITEAQVQATEDNTSALRDLTASNEALLAFADGVSAVTSVQAIRAMSDVMSGQLGYRAGARALMPGSGALSRL